MKLLIPFFLQILLIGFDEFYFHIRRGLPRWERIGHPLDTLSVVLIFLFTTLVPFSQKSFLVFLVLGSLSCLLITKDEWVHKDLCEGFEQWLHALLFINHTLLLLSLALLWKEGTYSLFITGGLVLASLFCLYQTLYWNVLWKKN